MICECWMFINVAMVTVFHVQLLEQILFGPLQLNLMFLGLKSAKDWSVGQLNNSSLTLIIGLQYDEIIVNGSIIYFLVIRVIIK